MAQSCEILAVCVTTGSGTRIYPHCFNWHLWAHSFLMVTFLSLDLGWRFLILLKSDLPGFVDYHRKPYPFWGGDEGEVVGVIQRELLIYYLNIILHYYISYMYLMKVCLWFLSSSPLHLSLVYFLFPTSFFFSKLWVCFIQEHTQGFVHKSMGTLSVATPLKNLSLSSARAIISLLSS